MNTLEAPGPMMRRLRLERNLTLRAAASAIDKSPSSLSRLERELRAVERHDIEAAIRGYGLSHWEAGHLLSSAGFAPPHPPSSDGRVDWAMVSELLRAVNLPANVVDEFSYFLAWNGEMHALWQMTGAPVAPIHALDALFSARGRADLGDAWMETASIACWQYYVKTLQLAGDPRYRRTLSALAEKYGMGFISVWNQAVSTGFAAGWSKQARANLVLAAPTREGAIEYLVLQNVTHAVLPIELYVYVPLGAQSIERHARLMMNVEQGHMVRCPRPVVR